MKNYRLIVTSGPTREYIDPIRFISNASTGKMGFFIAQAAIQRGWNDVHYICGAVPSQFQQVAQAQNILVDTTQQMLQAVLQSIKENSILIMAAAPADYQTEHTANLKLKKNQYPILQLKPTVDILQTVNQKAQDLKNFFAFGFAAETDHVEKHALKKLKEKNLEMIFVNDITLPKAGFGVDTNRLTVLKKDGKKTEWNLAPKKVLGNKIIQEIELWLELLSPSTTKHTNS